MLSELQTMRNEMLQDVDFVSIFNNLNESISDKFVFFNHGYYPNISKEKDIFATAKNLYLYMYEKSNLHTEISSVLEIGCGRGGGSAFLKERFPKIKYDACDLNQKNIDFCKEHHPKEINYKVCDAQQLDYPENKYDLILNIESCHGYSDIPNFLSSVEKSLKPNGVLCLADIFSRFEYEYVMECFNNSNLELLSLEEITKNVIDSLEDIIRKLNHDKVDLTSKDVSKLLHISSDQLRKYIEETQKYYCFMFRKSENGK